MTESPLRRAQLIHTFGVGSLYLTNEKVGLISGGLDFWYKTAEGKDIQDPKEFKIIERRLAKRLVVDHFMQPPDYRIPLKSYSYNSNAKNTKIRVPFLRFPRWHYCINRKCASMRKISLNEMTNKPRCEKKECNTRMVQVPLIAICPDGHIDDFPWNEFVHRTLNPKCSGNNLKFRFTGVPSLAGQMVKCYDCDISQRTLSAALRGHINIAEGVKYACKGTRPWLDDLDGEICTHDLTGSQRSSQRVYFAKNTSSIYIPEGDNNINPDLDEIFNETSFKVFSNSLKLPLKFKKIKLSANNFLNVETINDKDIKENFLNQNSTLNFSDRLAKFTESEIEAALNKYINNYDIEENTTTEEIEDEFGSINEEESYRYKEYNLLLKRNKENKFETIPIPINKYGNVISKYFQNISLVNKLVETTALYGFTRVKSDDNQKLEEHKSKLRLKPIENFSDTWLPATQTTGEGFFLELKKDILNKWESDKSIINRVETIYNNFKANAEDVNEDEFPPARKILLHTIAHLLINQLVFDCGYGASSIKERIYSSLDENKDMAGILIYTSGGDSEGSMGGLVRMARPGYLEDTFKRALINSSWCSVDPVCTEIGSSSGQGPNSANLAACHNCALVPETSCEMFNSFLDRIMVTGHYKDRSLGFMGEEVKKIE